MNNLNYPAYVFRKNDLTFVRVSDDSKWLHLFEISDVLGEDLHGWDSSGRRFTLEWVKKEAGPRPNPGESNLVGFRTAVEFYKDERKGVCYPEPFFGSTGQEVSPAKMGEIIDRVESSATDR